MRKLFTPTFILFLVVVNIYFFLSNIPLLTSISRTPPGTIYPLYHANHSYDYNVYLSAITQGANGSLLMKDVFTSEETSPSTFYIFYIYLGKIAKLFSLTPQLAYHLGRVIAGQLFFITLYFFNIKLLGSKLGFWASLFAILLTIAPKLIYAENEAFISYFPWWGNLEAFKRVDQMPHYLAGFALLLFSLGLFLSYIQTFKLSYLVGTIVSTFVGGLIFPPSLLPIIICLPIGYLVSITLLSVAQKKLTVIKKHLIGLSVVVFFATLSLLIILHENQNGFPWNMWNKWEISMWNIKVTTFNRALIYSFAPSFLFAIGALLYVFKSGEWKYIFVALWAFLPFILLPVINFIGISKYRLVSSAPFVPIGILVTLTLFQVVKKNILQKFLIILLLIYSLAVTFDYWKINVNQAKTEPLYTNIYIPDSKWKAIEFVKNNVAKNSVILSDEYMGNIMPAYAPVISYFGHPVHTQDFFGKQKLVGLFYRNKMRDNEAKQFIRQNKIKFVYFGDNERNLGEGTLNYAFLKKVYENPDVIIYQTMN